MTLAGSLLPLICWLLYPLVVVRFEPIRPSLSGLMNKQRVRWVANAVHRETPLDAILSANLMGSVSFFASTTVLLVLALFAVLGQLPALSATLTGIRSDPPVTGADLQIHLIAVQAMFILAFLSFTLSLRQFNHFCIMLGAAEHEEKSSSTEIKTIAELNSMGARNFNQGIRAYYFSVASLAWFLSPVASIIATLAVMGFLIQREFFSRARDLLAKLKTD